MKAIEKLVQEVSPKDNYKIDVDTEKLVIYRPRTGEYLYQTSFLDKIINTSDRHFIVNFQQFEKIESLECEIYDPKANSEIKLKVTCVVGCVRARAHKLVRLVSKSKDLEDTIRKLFVNWTNSFIDISNESIKKDFTEIDGKLRRHYEEYAAQRGIRLTIIRIDLDDEIGEFLEGFSFATDHDEDPKFAETNYHTKEVDVNVRLRVNVTGKGESLGGNLVKYNRKGKSLIKEIKLQTIEFIRQWMRQIAPEEIYMSDRDKTLDVLAGELSKFYVKEFNVHNAKFSLFLLDTEPKTRVEGLMSHEGTFEIMDATEGIDYEITYSVAGVTNWSTFILKQKRYFGNTIEEYLNISKLLKNEIERGINRAYGIQIEWIKTEEFDEFIRELFYKAAREVIELHHGLLLGTPFLKRNTIPGEKDPNDPWMMRLDIQKKRRLQLLKVLEEYEMAGDMEEEIEEVEMELKKVRKKIQEIHKQLPTVTPTNKQIETQPTENEEEPD